MGFRVERHEYATAVEAMLKLAQMYCGGSRVAAQVLLSAYNGDHYQLDVADMRVLSRENHDYAMAVIQGRYDTNLEPHNLVVDGDQIFQDLCVQYQGLRLSNRSKLRCTSCKGTGTVYRDDVDEDGTSCHSCAGTGRVCECEAR